ncbi:ABC transporter permease [Falsirhodobacter sp. 20TX0035]|uniref:ABC transporter permease n=1 Tax=Falsirhodobacter sp. 20TX0035 TaxID=3022019 RepID=UPI00232C0F13|nr:ABC transporter permease [Falsirhodobacter sp. 20TX0035]MDB6454079.1 ABC transporter permease [Falsirhodobacter sp. 20TX0035]
MTDLTTATPRLRAGRNSREALMRFAFFLLVLAVFVIFAILRPTFVTPGNIHGMLMSASIGGLMFLGLTWLIAAGEIDVSFMSVAALSNMVVAGLVLNGAGWGLAALGGLGAGIVFGLLNATLVAVLRLPALVITIATGALAASIAAAIGLGTSIALTGTGFVGQLLDLRIGVLPLIAVIVGALYAASWFVQERLTFGHYIYAMEQNRAAVVEAGVPVNRMLFLLFVLSGTVSSLAGVLLAANLSSGQPYLGASYFLDGLTAVLLGGMALKLGKPNVIGTLTATIFLIGLLNGAALLGWTDSERQIVRGSLLLIGVGLVVFARTRRKA